MNGARFLQLGALAITCGLAMGSSCSQNLEQAAGSLGRSGLGETIAGGDSKTANLIKAGGTAFDTLSIRTDVQRQRDIGESLAVSLSNSPGLVHDSKLTDYVIKVGLTVASACPRDDIDFTFGVLDTSEVNAYSAPHGYIFVTRGAIEQMQDEAELAGVLAHEIGHIVKNHGIDTLVAQGTLRTGVTAATADQDQQLAGLLGASVDTLLNTEWNKPQETEADLEAVKYLKAAGYDPHGFVRFLSRLPSSESTLKSHPRSADRIAKVKQAIGAHTGGATLAERFRAATGK